MLIGAAAIAVTTVALAVAAFAANLLGSGTGAPLSTAPSASSVITATDAPTSIPPSAADVPPTSAPDVPAEIVQAYYALLPDDTDAAWARLGSTAQAQSGGREGFDRFYAGLQSVAVEDVHGVGDFAAVGTVVFTTREGSVARERYRFETGPRQRIESFSHE